LQGRQNVWSDGVKVLKVKTSRSSLLTPARRQFKSTCLASQDQASSISFIGLAYQGKDIVVIFIIEYSSLMDFGPWVTGLFPREDF